MKSGADTSGRLGLHARRCLIALLFAGASHAAIFEVNTNTDPAVPVTVGCDATECTLREAITAANALAGADAVSFNIPGAGEQLIALTSLLPDINQALSIDGYTQPLATLNDAAGSSNANLLIRVDGAALPGSSGALFVCASNVVISGLSITNFSQQAIAIGARSNGTGCSVGTISGSVIRGNFIGLATDGVTPGPIGSTCIFTNAGAITVGGASVADRNVISRCNSGVQVVNSISNGSTVLNNLFGTDRTALLNRGGNGAGVSLAIGASNVQIGSAAAPNLIAYYGRGIDVTSSTNSGHRFAHNRIHSNLGLGIDIGSNGVTSNDPNDTDAGANGIQNFPVIQTAAAIAGSVNVSGTLDVGNAAGLVYTLAVYASDRCDNSGHGEGQRLVGAADVTLSTTTEAFNINLVSSETLLGRTSVTMTATHPTDGTSEFSACFRVNPDAALIVNSANDVDDGVCDAGHCSLRESINDANNAPGHDVVQFNIPGTGPHRIDLTSALPLVSGPITIDAYSQPGASVNTHPNASNALLKILIDAGAYSSNSGGMLNLSAAGAAGSVVRGLAIVDVRGGAPAILAVGDIRVQGNWFGVEPDGVTTATLVGPGVRVDGSSVTIGGTLAEHRNVFVASTSSFGAINSTTSGSGHLFENNLIGLRPDGITGQGNLNGLFWNGGTQTNVVVRNNTISCNHGSAMGGTSGGVGTLVEANRFGTTSDGVGNPACSSGRARPRLNSRWQGNLFAFHSARAIEVAGTTSGVSFLHNRFIANATYDLDLNADGHTVNDASDADAGANNLQNFPLLTSARRISDTQLEISGTLNSSANTTYTVEFFGNIGFLRDDHEFLR